MKRTKLEGLFRPVVLSVIFFGGLLMTGMVVHAGQDVVVVVKDTAWVRGEKIYLKDENGKILKKDKISSTLWNKIKDRLGGPVTSLIRMPLNFYTGFTLLELKEGKKSITETRSVTRLDENGQPTFETVKVEVEREGLYMIIRNDLTGEKSIRWQTKSKDLNLEEE